MYMFTLILIYYYFLPLPWLKCKILVKIPDSISDSALALQGKEDDIVREKKYKLSNLSDLVKIKPKYANGKNSLKVFVMGKYKHHKISAIFVDICCFILSF